MIDDLGYNAQIGRQLVEFPGDLTLAILPFTPHGRDLAELAASLDKEVMIHAPMSNSRDLPLGPGALESDLSEAEFGAHLNAMLQDLPQARGLNNHMGSQLTEELAPMNWLMRTLLERKLYFVDSRTSARSLALQTARLWQVPGTKRDIFLDNQRNSAHITQQLHKALALAQRRGRALAIGHPYPETLEALQELPALLATYNVRLVKTSKLLKPPRPVAMACPAPPVLLWRRVNTQVPSADNLSSENLPSERFGYEY